MKLHAVQLVVVELPAQNSCVVFDIPIESRTILPLGLEAPAVSRGTMPCARVIPAAACAAGAELLPLGYRPPVNPLYIPAPSSERGTRACVAGAAGDPASRQAPAAATVRVTRSERRTDVMQSIRRL